MKILEKFLTTQLNPEEYKYIELIKLYCYEKIWDPRDDPDDSSNYLTFLIFSANAECVKKSDIKILLLLEMCFSIGIALIDDVVDNELTAIWEGVSKQEIISIACLFTCIFPQRLILQSNDISPKIKVNLIKLINKYYLRISSGEYKQVSNSINYYGKFSLMNNIEVMRLKTGEWKALIATIAIYYAGKIVTSNNIYIKFARELGILRQIKNDVYDIYIADTSQDLLNGVINFPIAAHMILQNGKKKEEILREIELGKKTKVVNEQFRQQLINQDLISLCVLILDLQKYKLSVIVDRLGLSPELKQKYIDFVNG